MASESIALGPLEQVYPLLDLLQVGFVLIGPDGQVEHASGLARRTLGRRVDGAAVRTLLGEFYEDLLGKVLSGETWTTRWRDHKLESPEGDVLDLAMRSVCVDRADGGRSALLAFYDVSVEIALHARYKSLLERQEAINEELRRRIAVVLREHEDDHAQFHELLQIAPAIFASFVAEAEAAMRAVASVADAEHLDDVAVIAALREGHTLKGNARGLGLNFIAGRAHAVEDLLAGARTLGRLPDRAELAAGVADLGRAIERAVAMRGGLEAGTAPTSDSRADLAEVAGALAAAAAAVADPALQARLLQAHERVERLGRVPLAQLLHYLRTTARTAAEAVGLDPPTIDAAVGDIAVPPAIHAALQTALPHLVRNAVVHGLEPGPERAAAGKPAAGVISIEAEGQPHRLVVTVRDDGRGIDRDRLAAAAGRPDATLAELVFAPGLSTRAAADLDAGRGIGALAARDAIRGVGGTLDVATTPGKGTIFTATLPLPR